MGVRLARLEDVAEVRLGRQRSPKNHVGTQMRPYVRAANVGWDGLLLHDVKTMNFTDAEMNVYRLTSGDLLLGEASGSAKEVGKPAIWSGEIEECAFQNTLLRVRARDIDPRYLLHFFKHEAKSGNFASQSRGVGIYHLGKEALASWLVPLPPMPEQVRIAEILDRADALRAKRREAITQLDVLAQSIFLDMFGDPVSNPKGWERRPLGRLLAHIDSGVSPICLDRPATGEEWGVLKLGAVTSCEYNPLANKALPKGVEPRPLLEVRPGDLLFTRKNTYDLVAACALVGETPPHLMLPDLIFRLRLSPDAELDPSFLQQLLVYPAKRREVQRLASGSAASMPNISKARLAALGVESPPMALQTAFARHIAGIEQLKVTLRKSAADIGTLFESLQYRAFRGEL